MTDLFTGHPIPVEEKIAELERELRQRAFVFPRLVAQGKLTQAKADRRTAVLTAVLDDYRAARPR